MGVHRSLYNSPSCMVAAAVQPPLLLLLLYTISTHACPHTSEARGAHYVGGWVLLCVHVYYLAQGNMKMWLFSDESAIFCAD